jgi:pyruvate kinase
VTRADVTHRPPAAPPQARASLAIIAGKLLRIERSLAELEVAMGPALDRVAGDHRESAKNLVHYVALRQHDLRELQLQLSMWGLSSLGRSESCVKRSLLEVSARAHESLALHGDPTARRELSRIQREARATMSWDTAKSHLHQHTRDVLGPRPDDRHIYVMVTAPSAKEADRAWMTKALRAGMNVLRINCAHEAEREWEQVVSALGEARKDTGKECRVLMDLAGPKIRTGPMAAGRQIATWKPARDDIGRAKAPAQVVIHRASTRPDPTAAPFLYLGDQAFDSVRRGDSLRFLDARGKGRRIDVQDVAGDVIVGFANQRAYVLTEVRARVVRGRTTVGKVQVEVGGESAGAIDVKTGDTLVLTGRRIQGRAARRDQDGRVLEPGEVACTLPAALLGLEVGHRVLFDDGSIHAVVEGVRRKGRDYLIRVVRTKKETARLKAEKGINLPDTAITVPSLSADDLRALAFVAKHADAVSLSFVRRPEDIRFLHRELARLRRANIGVVLKIETRAGFENLPRLLLEGLRRPPLAVMIARGDLGVEVGFERLAELQEEILWLCEASHVPAIWATQVLDSLARTGIPSRAEVTDAAASVAAECVMLNKGPFVDEAVRVLADILRRMEKHHYKKRSLFRKLRVSTFAEQ